MTTKLAKLGNTSVYLINQSLLGGWLCVPDLLSEDEVLPLVIEKLNLPSSWLAPPVKDPELIRDRLFGGFGCEDQARRHVYYAIGRYTFIEGNENYPLSAEARAEVWRTLLDSNSGSSAYKGGRAFTTDAPKNGGTR